MTHASDTRTHILVVDADERARDELAAALGALGHRVLTADEPVAAMRAFYAHRPALVVLDVMLGGHDGWRVLERVRELSADVPVMVLTAHDRELDRIRAFRHGADQFVPKPIGPSELGARVTSLLRRTPLRPAGADVHDDGLLRIDFRAASVTVAGQEVRLTPLEFRLLTALARHSGHVLSHHQLLDLAWNDDGAGARSGDEVRVYIGYLRRKLGAVLDAAPIETVRGFGYRYAPDMALAVA